MSKKYVPSFLKDQQSTPTPSNTNTQSNSNASRWSGQNTSTPLSASNKFAALSDDFTMNKKDKPIINTSLPAQLAPKLAPATLASITGGGSGAVVGASASGSKKSFADKFKEQARIAADPNYKPPPKPINVQSEDDFPSLGAPKKAPSGAWGVKPSVAPSNTVAESDEKPLAPSFAEKAREWATKKAEEEEKARMKAAMEEKARRDGLMMRTIPLMGMRRFRNNDYNDDEEDDYYNHNDASSLGDDSYEVPEDDAQPSEEEDDEDNDEFNQNVGWDGRRKDDLY